MNCVKTELFLSPAILYQDIIRGPKAIERKALKDTVGNLFAIINATLGVWVKSLGVQTHAGMGVCSVNRPICKLNNRFIGR